MSERPDRLRSLLFAPASRPDVVAKLPRSGPDGVVLDMEDAVPPGGKVEARTVARELGPKLATEHPELAVYVRVNSVVSEWFDDDVRTALTPELAGVVVPKLESVAQLERVVDAARAAPVARSSGCSRASSPPRASGASRSCCGRR